MTVEKIIKDLSESVITSVDKRIPAEDRRLGVVSGGGTTVTIGALAFSEFLTYEHVGTLEDGDMVDVSYISGERRPIVVGKVLNTRLQVGKRVYAYKTSNETVTSSTAVQADDQLTLAVLANAVYKVRQVFLMSGDDLGDFKFNNTYPAAATLSGGIISLLDSSAGGVSTAGSANFWAHTAETTPSSQMGVGIADTNFMTAIYEGVLTMSSTAGSFLLQWAQNTSSLTGTVLRVGSHISLDRIS